MGSAPARAPRTSRPLLVVLSAGLVLALAAVTVAGVRLRTLSAEERDTDAAVAAAWQQAADLTSISHETAPRDIDRVLDGATGELAEQFRSEREQLAALLASKRSRSEGEVLGAGLVRLEDRSATVLVAADATVTNAETPSPRVQRYRMSMDLRKVGERWLVEQVLFAGAPA